MKYSKLHFDSIPVLGRNFHITWGPDHFRAESAKDPTATAQDYGHTFADQRRIFFNPDECETQEDLESTVLHELIHAVLGTAGHAEQFEEDEEEAYVISLENGLYPIICSLVERGYFRRSKRA